MISGSDLGRQEEGCRLDNWQVNNFSDHQKKRGVSCTGSFQTGSRDEERENGFVQQSWFQFAGMGRKDSRPWPVFGGYLRVGCSPRSYLTAEASDDIQGYICDLDQLGWALGFGLSAWGLWGSGWGRTGFGLTFARLSGCRFWAPTAPVLLHR